MFTVIILYGRYILAVVIIAFLLFGCRAGMMQGTVGMAKLEKIEVKYRYPDYVGWLTWLDHNKNEIVVEIPIEDTANYRVGMEMFAVMRR